MIDSLNCDPATVATDEIVSCAPDVSGAVDTHWWTASGGSPSSGTDGSFSTRFGSAGRTTITLLVCDDRCSSAQQTIEVSALTVASEPTPRIASLNCSPTTATTEDTIFCAPSVTGDVTLYSWYAAGGAPSNGFESTFSSLHSSTGTKRFILQACNRGGCSSKLQTVLVGPPPDPSDSDGDGILDPDDNCELISNPDQANVDGDRSGDACDTQDNRDGDGDGIENWQDQCPSDAENVDGYLDKDGCPDSPEVSVSIQQGGGFVFESGQAVTICYVVSSEMFVDLDVVAPSGLRLDILSAFDDGTGGCFDWDLGLEADAGVYVVEISGAGAQDSASFEAR